MAAAVAVVVIVAVAGGVGIFLSSKGSTLTSTSSTTGSSSSSMSSFATTNSTGETSNSTTSSSSAVPVGCVFSPPGPFIVNGTGFIGSKDAFYTGCLTANATGVYLFGIADPNGVITKGVVKTDLASNITIAGAAVGNLAPAGNGSVALTAKTVLGMPDVHFLGSRGYSVTVENQSGQNETVTINLIFEDYGIVEGGG